MCASPADELGDHLGVDHRPTGGDPLHRLDHLADVGDPVLEQVADPAGPVLQELDGVVWLDVLRHHQHPNRGVFGADVVGGVEALVRVGRGHADVNDDCVGRVGPDPRDELLAVADLGGHADPGGLEHSGQALAEQHRVVGDHDLHGSSAVTQVPSPVRLRT